MATIAQMLTANGIASSSGAFEPQRQNNWMLDIIGGSELDDQTIQLALESSNLPQEGNEAIEIFFGNERRWVAGRATYETTPLIVKDFVNAAVADYIIAWRQKVYSPKTGAVGLTSQYKRMGQILLFAPNGDTSVTGGTIGSRQWELQGLWPEKVNYGALNMTANDKVLIEVTLRYDIAYPLKGWTGAGVTLGGPGQ